jgi:hypothetical protein
MAERKTIKITISPKGEVSFTIEGVKGEACVAETKFLEDALGGEILSREATGEMYEQGEVDQVTNKRG